MDSRRNPPSGDRVGGAPDRPAPRGVEAEPTGGGTTEPKRARTPVSSRLIELALGAGADLFHAPGGAPYARVPREGRLEVYAVEGARFRELLDFLYYRAEGRAPGTEAVAAALRTLGAIATFDGPEHPVHRRVAPGPDGSLVVDLCDDRWRVVVVRPGGWDVRDRSPVMFDRGAGMHALPEPVRGGTLADLRPFLNLRSHEDWLLVVAWLAAALRPTGPYPLLHLKGEQGTAKSTAARVLRRLVDPNKTDLRPQPRSEQDLAVSTRHEWVMCFDNLSTLSAEESNALCRVATGGGFGTRRLFTDDEEATFEYSRPVLVTSIGDVIGQPDLLDRSLAVELAPIPDHERRAEAALWAEYNAARPHVLGALLDVVADALERLPGVAAEGRPVPRMADFALFGEAVARALGEPPGRFLEVLRAARAGADQDALDGTPAARALLDWVREPRTFGGTWTQLLGELNARAPVDARRERGWPKGANALSKLVREAEPALKRLGVKIVHTRVGREKTRTVAICYDPAADSGRSSPPSAAGATPLRTGRLGADGPEAAAPSVEQPQDRVACGPPSAPPVAAVGPGDGAGA